MAEKPQRGGVTWFGNPLGGSAMMSTDSKTTLREIYAEWLLLAARKRGDAPTPELFATIDALSHDYEAKAMKEIRARGIVADVRKLVQAKRKKEAIRVARGMVLRMRDLDDFRHNCALVGLSHHAKFLDFLPEDRMLTPEDNEILWGQPVGPHSPQARKVFDKVRQIFIQREHRSVHMFADSRERWHLFTMTFRDVVGDPQTKEHHWKEGPHVHYLSHLWEPRLRKADVWKALDERTHSLPGEHIRFRELPTAKDDGRRFAIDMTNGRVATLK